VTILTSTNLLLLRRELDDGNFHHVRWQRQPEQSISVDPTLPQSYYLLQAF